MVDLPAMIDLPAHPVSFSNEITKIPRLCPIFALRNGLSRILPFLPAQDQH